MATYDLEEQERLDALKDWWNKWQRWVLLTAAAFLIGVSGVLGWQAYQANENEKAETLFKEVEKIAQESTANKEAKKLSDAATALADKYPRTFFATDAQLLAAKVAFEANDFAAAKLHLQWVANKGRDAYRSIARIRMASVMLEEKKYDDALKTLDEVKEAGFISLAADLKGDIFASQGRNDEARSAYQLAIEKADTRSALRGITQIKLDAVGGALETKKTDASKSESKEKEANK